MNSKVLDCGDVEKAFIGVSIEMMLLEVSENFSDMALVFFLRVGVDEYVVYIHQYANIKQVAKNIIYKALESSRCIGESEGHHIPFEGAVVSPESHCCGFPLYFII